MKSMKKITIGLLATITLSVTVPTFTTAYASEVTVTSEDVSNAIEKFQGISDEELKDLGFSEKEIATYHKNLDKQIYIRDGEIVNKNNQISPQGKFSSAVKIIKKGYNKLPKKVKNIIAQYTGFSTILNFIENATGTLQNAIYDACIKVGMSKSVANIVTAAIMTIAF